MFFLTSASGSIIAATAGTANAIYCSASYSDLNTSTQAVTPAPVNTELTTTSATTVVGSPSSGSVRAVEFLSFQNQGASGVTLKVTHSDGTTTTNLQNLTLAAGYTLVFERGHGWQLFDSNGNLQTAIGTPVPNGGLIKATLLTSSSGTFTTSLTTGYVRVRMIGGGGQGGGGAAAAGECGSGGGAGSYAEWYGAVSANTGYSYTVGAGGSTGGTGAAGQAGGSTSITFGGTTITCNGGGGGKAGTSAAVPVIGGAGGAAGSGGTINVPGDSGLQSYGSSAADNGSGMGASSQFGSGGINAVESAATTGAAGTGYGAGGAGGTTTGTATAGGAGSAGCILVEEYT
jgi:hypothetical protein